MQNVEIENLIEFEMTLEESASVLTQGKEGRHFEGGISKCLIHD